MHIFKGTNTADPKETFAAKLKNSIRERLIFNLKCLNPTFLIKAKVLGKRI